MPKHPISPIPTGDNWQTSRMPHLRLRAVDVRTSTMHFAFHLVCGLGLILSALQRSVADGPPCVNCCNEYVKIDEPRRSVQSVWKIGQVALCDRVLKWQWYRFTSSVGGQMPTSVVRPHHCGTIAPVWLKGTHPKSDKVARRTACINFFGLNNGCLQSLTIFIKKCVGDFFVYFLGPTYSCAVAYCAGKEK